MSEYKEEAEKKLIDAGFTKEVAGHDFGLLVQAYHDLKTGENKKGLILIGGVGCGKTMAISALFGFNRVYDLTDSMTLAKLEPYEEYNGDFLETAWWPIKKKNNIILDDLGNESFKNDYGKKVDVVGEFILQFYAKSYKSRDSNARLFATSNLSCEKLLERYGSRVTDRLFEMVNTINMTGNSKRIFGKVYQ